MATEKLKINCKTHK